jgi:hypothetical protein
MKRGVSSNIYMDYNLARPARENPQPDKPDLNPEPLTPEPDRSTKKKKKSLYEITC